MYCTQCSATYPPTAHFCDRCGCALVASSSSVPVASAVATSAPTSDLKGLRGWLIVVGFGLIVNLMYRLYLIFVDARIFAKGTAQRLNDPLSTFHILGYAAFLRFELLCNLALLVAILYAAILFFHESRGFPRFYVSLLISFPIYGALDYGLMWLGVAHASQRVQDALHDTLQNAEFAVARSALAAMIWGLYMLKSKRVKATFVN
ncbi:MAG TPA: DUF2569 family protein [Candidatus Acidoferrales bacterium]|nr:DUF2569 family protein [Candidatus Acidoferrales bacterium]